MARRTGIKVKTKAITPRIGKWVRTLTNFDQSDDVLLPAIH